MKKEIFLSFMVFFFLNVLSAPSYPFHGLLKGRIVSFPKDRMHVSVGDRIEVDLGAKEGLVKGDMLILGSEQRSVIDASGRCVVRAVDEKGSLCEVIRVKREIGAEDFVFARPLTCRDHKFRPLVYSLASRIMEPYEPHERPRVWVDEIFDESGNVTEFSRRLKGEILYTMAQKAQIRLREDLPEGLSPLGASEADREIEEAFRKGVDVFVTGLYKTSGDLIEVEIRKYDARHGGERLSYTIHVDREAEEISKVVLPFRERERKALVGVKVVRMEKGFVPKASEKREIIAYEAQGDPFLQKFLATSGFNVVAPRDVKILIDNKIVPVESENPLHVQLEKGTHRIAISFRRGYFQDSRDVCVFTSLKEIRKEILVELKEEGPYTVITRIDASFVKDPITLAVRRGVERERMVLREIMEETLDNTVELFR